MKQKFLCLIIIIALLCSFTPTLVYGMTTENPNSTMEDTKSPRACHESFRALVDAMMKLKKDGVYTVSDIEKIHKFYESLVSNNTVPSNDLELLNLIYNNNLISKTQYEQTLALIK